MKRSLLTLLFFLIIQSVTKAGNYSDTSSHEGATGPIMLQGDHESIEYGSIIITPAE